MDVSVVIAARDAADTLGETLGSLASQTHDCWKAIVVDDGSADGTAEAAEAFARRDPRVRVLRQPPRGVSAARNAGLAEARGDCLLFLDADDWLCPRHLERMTTALVSCTAGVDGAYCGWRHVAPGGGTGPAVHAPADADLFEALTRCCAFAIHACVVRRSLVEAAGGFDPGLATCEDWDLWQRIARTGARFARVPEALALYRMRAASASLHVRRLLADGLRVIERGHAPDPRVALPALPYAAGAPRQEIAGAKLLFACWCGGLALGRREDPVELLAEIPGSKAAGARIDPAAAARSLFQATLLTRAQTPEDWLAIWPDVELLLVAFLAALERRTVTPAFARRTLRALERMVAAHAAAPRPWTQGSTHAVEIEATAPFDDVAVPVCVDRLHVRVLLEGDPLADIELPVCDGVVPAAVLADTVAAELAWPILGRYCERTAHRAAPAVASPSPLTRWPSRRRGGPQPATPPPAPEPPRVDFEREGWTIFLREVWGRPDWPAGRFYDPRGAREDDAPLRRADGGWLVAEVAAELPRVEIPSGETLDVVLRVGGVDLGIVTVPAPAEEVGAHELRVALTEAAGFELCRAVVREALLGVPLGRPGNLRERLAAASARHRREDPAAPAAGWPSTATEPAPGWQEALGRAIPPAERGAALARRDPRLLAGTSAARRAALSAMSLPELEEAAAVCGEPVLRIPGPDESTEPGPPRVLYVPDLLWRRMEEKKAPHLTSPTPYLPPAQGGRHPLPRGAEAVARSPSLYGRGHFEALFASGPDPWRYTSEYETTKYDQTLEMLPEGEMPRALELACAEGHFTVRLAPRVGHLVAADISRIALERAAERCAGLPNVEIRRLDLFQEPLPGPFPLIVCSEVLYYAGDRDDLAATARKLVDALEPGGHLLTTHANLVVDEPDRPGFDWDHAFGAKVIGDALSAAGLRRIRELRTPLYRVQLFRRPRRLELPRPAQLIEITDLPPLPPAVAARVRWQGGAPRQTAASGVVTHRLPILMYHQVAPDGPAPLARWRVTPQEFEEQLRYLRDAGYHTPRLADWRRAADGKRPLPGRAVLLTFDDGYRDFAEHAWPLLRRYGFSAVVFLVTSAVGHANRWDATAVEELPLLGWDEVRRLRDEGVEFGSHSATHRPMTALSTLEVVREATHSRAVLGRALGAPPAAFAYPYGDTDPAVRHLVGACGYLYGLSTRPGRCAFGDPLLDLPRIEVVGGAPFERFVAALEELR